MTGSCHLQHVICNMSSATCYLQIEEDTDRDRYMSPLEAKNYGLIDEVIGGDEAGFQISGTTRDFPKTKESYVNWVRPCVLSVILIKLTPTFAYKNWLSGA